MNWYYRMLLSYTPIFFVVISSIIFVFFLILNNDSEKKYIETNEAILERMAYNIDSNLMLIERNIVSQLLMNQAIQNFFLTSFETEYEYYEIQKKMIELKSTLPFQNNIYLYKESDERIITDFGAINLQAFGDQEFISSIYSNEHLTSWTKPRYFSQVITDESKQSVVTLVKYYYDGQSILGAIVVNVYVQHIIDYLNSFDMSDSTLVQLVDSSITNQVVSDETINVNSDYTGWQYTMSGINEKRYNIISSLSSFWIIIVIVLIVLALASFTFVTHMHYKPIQSIMAKIGQYSNRKNEELGIRTKDEFRFIEIALDQLLKRSMDYESLSKEDSILKQQRLFNELLKGHQTVSDQYFQNHLKSLNLPYQYDQIGVFAVEIDYYMRYTEKYNLRDQHLLKFIIENAFHELSKQYQFFVWHAWMEPQEIAFVVHYFKEEDSISLKQLALEFQKWIQNNLELTVSIGIGNVSDSVESVAISYRVAKENIMLKTIFGTNTIIDNAKCASKTNLDSYAYLQSLESMAHSFRMNDSDWREKLSQIFIKLKDMRLIKSEMVMFVNNFQIQMDKMVGSYSYSIKEQWKNEYQVQLENFMERIETVDELEEQLETLMTKLERDVDENRQARKHHSIALQAKKYIDLHYSDPNLSLTRVSEQLKFQPSALSQLFKEELGEKFIDYVLKIRMEKAKTLLIETDEQILAIAERVGYQNVISFYRVFKRVQGVPPGEYRTMYQQLEDNV